MALNTLQATLVKYDEGLNIDVTTGDAHVSINGAAPKAYPETSTVGYENNINDTKIYTNNHQKTVEFGEKYFTNLRLNDSDRDAFNRPSNTWTYLGKEVGSYARKADLEYTTTVTKAALYKDMKLSAATNAEFWVNGKTGTYTQGNTPGQKDTVNILDADGNVTGTRDVLNINRDNDASKATIGGNGTLTQVFAIERVTTAGYSYTEYVVTCIDTYVGDVTSKVAATASRDAYVYVTTRKGTSGQFNTSEFAVDDVVLYTYSEKMDGSKALGIQSVEKAETVTGTLTKYTVSKSLVAGDKTYNYSKNIANTANDAALKTDVTVVLDKYGYAIDVKAAAGATKYAVVLNYNKGVGYWNAVPAVQLLLSDGTVVEEAQLTAKDSKKEYLGYVDEEFQTGDIVSYTINSKDKYTLKLEANVNTNSDAKNSGSPAAVSVKNGEYQMANIVGYDGSAPNKSKILANGSTIFLVRSESDGESTFKAYNGIKNMPTINTKVDATTNATVFCKTGNIATLVYIDSVGTRMTTDSKNVIYVNYKDSVKLVNESGVGEYYAYQAIVNGEIVDDFKVGKVSGNINNVAAVPMYTNVTYSNGIAELDSTVNNNVIHAIGIEKVSNDVLGFGTRYGDKTYQAYVTSNDCKVFVKDVNGELSESSVSSVADSHLDSIWFTLNNSSQVNYVVIEKAAETAKETIHVFVTATPKGSTNVPLMFYTELASGQKYWLTVEEVKELGINDGMIKDLKIGTTELAKEAKATETKDVVAANTGAYNKDKTVTYPWNNTAICIVNSFNCWANPDAFDALYGVDAGYMKVHTSATITATGDLTFTIDPIGSFKFVVDAYTVA